MTNTASKPRYGWIDWMKTIGIYLIIVGHFEASSHEVVYVYSVPLFFIISGFLSRKMEWGEFWRKTLHNLIIPMLIVVPTAKLIQFLPGFLSGQKDIWDWAYAMLSAAWGQGYGVGAFWFVYTLVIIKCLYQVLPRRGSIVFAVLCCVGTYFYQRHGVWVWNSYVNTLLSFPLFLLGAEARRWRQQLSDIHSRKLLALLFALGLSGVMICVRYNGIPWMYLNDCGGNLGLFFLGGICGTVMIFSIAKLLDRYPCDFVRTISAGTCVILGYHQIGIFGMNPIFNRIEIFEGGGKLLLYYASSLIILLLFYPFLKFVKRYIPVLLGDR